MGDARGSRRRFLAKLGASGGGALAAIGLLGGPQTNPVVSAEEYATLSEMEHGRALATNDGRLRDGVPLVRWQHKLIRDGFRPTSPINVAVALDSEHSLDDVVAVLLDNDWYRDPEEYVRFARSPSGDYESVHDALAETMFGNVGRFHVRAWEFEGIVSIQVHEDEDPDPGHEIESYQHPREHLERLFVDAGWLVAPAAIEVGNVSGPDHDGRVTVIEP